MIEFNVLVSGVGWRWFDGFFDWVCYKGGYLYVSFDVDVFDLMLVLGVNMLEVGGIMF